MTTNIKRYKVAHEWHDHEVVLEVDHDILTPELAQEHIDFWSGADEFRSEENGDDVRATIRLFGSTMIRMMQAEGGAEFSERSKHMFDESAGKLWSQQLQNEEGWGGADGTPYGRVGIRVIAADVTVTGFDDVSLVEVSQ